jgi:hypothetical protein
MENKLKISEDTVVYCETEELAKQVLRIADSLGYKWSSGESFLYNNQWKVFGDLSHYFLHEGFVAKRDWFDLKYNVISAQEFIDLHKPKTVAFEERDFENHKSNIGIKESNGKKDYSEINLEILDLMADRFAANKHKYPKGNMKKPIDIKSLEWALFRHIKKLVQPIENDEESYIDHLSAILCNASMILDQLKLCKNQLAEN